MDGFHTFVEGATMEVKSGLAGFPGGAGPLK